MFGSMQHVYHVRCDTRFRMHMINLHIHVCVCVCASRRRLGLRVFDVSVHFL